MAKQTKKEILEMQEFVANHEIKWISWETVKRNIESMVPLILDTGAILPQF